jgi:hypothetical protein
MRSFLITWVAGMAVGTACAATTDGRQIPTDFAGQLIAAQSIGTAFGNDTNPSQSLGGGSELNAMYVNPDIASGRLRLGITGNLEDIDNDINGNGIIIYLDTRSGGENILDSNGGFSNTGARYVPAMEGTRFDAGFAPDMAIVVNSAGAGFGEYFVDTIDFASNTRSYRGRGVLGGGTGSLTGGLNTSNWLIAFDNSNTAGVGAFVPGAADGLALTATSGLELDLAAADLGLATGWTLGIQIMISGGNFPSYLSNQNLPSLPIGTNNLAQAPVDYRSFAGDQFSRVTVVPAPFTGMLGLAAAMGFAARRRRGTGDAA